MKLSSIKYLISEGFKNFWNNKMMSLVSVGQLMSCLILTGCAVLFSLNLSTFLKSVEDQNSIKIYLNMNVSSLESAEIEKKIREIPNISECKFIPSDEGIKKYSEMLGDTVGESVFNDLNDALPGAFKISMKELSLYDQTVEKIKEINGVDKVYDRSDIAKKLTNLSSFVSTASFLIFIVLSLDSLFIISNTIKITMYSRRLEISIMKSVGATDWFVRIPFIIEGMIIGIISAFVSTFILNIFYNGAIDLLKNMLPFDQHIIKFSSVWIPVTLLFIVSGVIFGLIGGMISISKYLKKEGGDIIG